MKEHRVIAKDPKTGVQMAVIMGDGYPAFAIGANTALKPFNQSVAVVGALGRRAEELYGRLDPRARAACRQVFLRLVSVDPAAQDTRRRVRRR